MRLLEFSTKPPTPEQKRIKSLKQHKDRAADALKAEQGKQKKQKKQKPLANISKNNEVLVKLNKSFKTTPIFSTAMLCPTPLKTVIMLGAS
jgi:hypothetical protein